MIIVYNRNSFEEVICNKPAIHLGSCIDDIKAKIELTNRDLPESEKSEVYEGEVFPPVGKFFEVGVGLRDKTVNGETSDNTNPPNQEFYLDIHERRAGMPVLPVEKNANYKKEKNK